MGHIVESHFIDNNIIDGTFHRKDILNQIKPNQTKPNQTKPNQYVQQKLRKGRFRGGDLPRANLKRHSRPYLYPATASSQAKFLNSVYIFLLKFSRRKKDQNLDKHIYIDIFLACFFVSNKRLNG